MGDCAGSGARRTARGPLLGPLLLLSLALHLGAVAWLRLPVSPASEYPVRLNIGLVVAPEPETKAAPDHSMPARGGRPPAAKRVPPARTVKPDRAPP